MMVVVENKQQHKQLNPIGTILTFTAPLKNILPHSYSREVDTSVFHQENTIGNIFRHNKHTAAHTHTCTLDSTAIFQVNLGYRLPPIIIVLYCSKSVLPPGTGQNISYPPWSIAPSLPPRFPLSSSTISIIIHCWPNQHHLHIQQVTLHWI